MPDDVTEVDWGFIDSERFFSEIHLADSDKAETDGEGFVVKEILRTGEWPVIPTGAGLVDKPLHIVRDGVSDKKQGRIALEEIVQNFKAGAIARPQIPLSDDSNDHKNLTRVNTGFVKDLWIEDGEDGMSKLVAKMEFTEPDVKEKVLRGTFADVSAGIPWNIRSRGKEYGAVLEHVAITNRPFIDGLGPFLAASDSPETVDVAHFGVLPEEKPDPAVAPEAPEPEKNSLIQAMRDSATNALKEQLGLPEEYKVTAVTQNSLEVTKAAATETTWTVPFKLSENGLVLSSVSEWKIVEEEEEIDVPVTPPPIAASENPRQLSPLEEARQLRELRLSQPNGNGSGGSAMPIEGIAALDGLELSDEARAAIQTVLDENADLRSRNREADADARVEELKGLGLEERPGALTFYRQIFLADDDGPAVVLLSDDGKKTQMTALEVLDKFIEAIKGSEDTIALSNQHLASGNDDKPPVDAGDEAPLDERVAQTREFLTGKK